MSTTCDPVEPSFIPVALDQKRGFEVTTAKPSSCIGRKDFSLWGLLED
jgi:hypothetical protein